MSAMSREYAEIEDVKEAFLDHIHAVFDAADVERVLSNDRDIEAHFDLFLDYAVRGGTVDPDVAADLFVDPSPVLEGIGS
jgi:hypothetical protein